MIGTSCSEAIVSDTIGTLTHLEVESGKRLGNYKGFSGAVTGIIELKEESQIATICIDSFLRVYQRSGERRMVSKVITI